VLIAVVVSAQVEMLQLAAVVVAAQAHPAQQQQDK
jgi:hypothetical protein